MENPANEENTTKPPRKYIKEIQVAPETRAALLADTTIRCFQRVKIRLPSRESALALFHAQTIADLVVEAVMEAVSQKAAEYGAGLHMVYLQGRRVKVNICYDLFVNARDEALISRIAFDSWRPIHQVVVRHGICHVYRNTTLDHAVNSNLELAHEGSIEWPPYFNDTMHPAHYENGIRVENPKPRVYVSDDEEEVGGSSTESAEEQGEM